MIGIPLTSSHLWDEIERVSPTWRVRAERKSDVDKARGSHLPSKKNIWTDIKDVYIRHQRGKCAYCETFLGDLGIKWDMEHFRPKGGVASWHGSDGSFKRTGRANKRGYFWLAYEPQNYLASCKPCNTLGKGNGFPVGRRRRLKTVDPTELRKEQAYLLNPLDELETPPEELIGFVGCNPRPLKKRGRDYRRALMIIDLLNLNSETLNGQRAAVIHSVWLAIKNTEHGDPEGAEALEIACGPGAPFSSCARNFLSLYGSDRELAGRLAEEAKHIVRLQAL